MPVAYFGTLGKRTVPFSVRWHARRHSVFDMCVAGSQWPSQSCNVVPPRPRALGAAWVETGFTAWMEIGFTAWMEIGFTDEVSGLVPVSSVLDEPPLERTVPFSVRWHARRHSVFDMCVAGSQWPSQSCNVVPPRPRALGAAWVETGFTAWMEIGFTAWMEIGFTAWMEIGFTDEVSGLVPVSSVLDEPPLVGGVGSTGGADKGAIAGTPTDEGSGGVTVIWGTEVDKVPGARSGGGDKGAMDGTWGAGVPIAEGAEGGGVVTVVRGTAVDGTPIRPSVPVAALPPRPPDGEVWPIASAPMARARLVAIAATQAWCCLDIGHIHPFCRQCLRSDKLWQRA